MLHHGEGPHASPRAFGRPQGRPLGHPPVHGSVSGVRADPGPDGQRARQRHGARARRLGPDPDLRHHGRGQLRPRRPRDAGRLHRQLLARAPGGVTRHRGVRGAAPDHHAPAPDRPGSPDHHHRDVRDLPGAPEVRPLAVRPDGPEHPAAHPRPVRALLPAVPLVSPGRRGDGRRHHRRALSLPQVRQVRDLDPRHHPGPRDGLRDGHPGATGPHRRVRDRLRHGGRLRCAVRTPGRGDPDHGLRLHAARVHRGGRGRDGQPGWIHPRGPLHQPARGVRLPGGEPLPGRHRLVRRLDPHPALPADGTLRAHPEVPRMNPRTNTGFWIGFVVVVTALAVVPLGLPEFWRKFLTEILIWGLLAMSSDILIGYTGMVSFGHSAFFGLGLYGAAAALLVLRSPNLWAAMFVGLATAAVIAIFVAYFSTRLRDIYFAITTLVFSQIFYVIIFTWTDVTGGENGLTFARPALSIPGLFSVPFTTETLHWFVLAVVAVSFLILRRVTQSPFGMVLQAIRENEPRARAIGYSVERYKIVAVM